MVQPLVATGIDVILCTKWALVQRALGALVYDGALVAGKRCAVLFAFEEILSDLRANLFQNKADMRGKRIVAQHRMAGLDKSIVPMIDNAANNASGTEINIDV